MGKIDKLVYICIGIIFLGSIIGFFSCSQIDPGKAPPLTQPPSSDILNIQNAIHAESTDVGGATTQIGNTATKIETAATQGSAKTPNDIKPTLDPFWNTIVSGVGELRGDVTVLKAIQQKLNDAETLSKTSEENAKNWETKYRADMSAWAKKYDDDHQALLKSQSSETKTLREKYIWISIACFVTLIVCIALGISGFGGGQINGIVIAGAAASAIGLLISIALVQTVALIPWVVGGIALLASGYVIYQIVEKNKALGSLTKVNKEIVHTVEASKLFMTVAGRKVMYGDGPVVGKAHSIQSDATRDFVKKARLGLSNLAPSLPITISRNDGINEKDEMVQLSE